MSDHNNIYNIMGKINALTPKEEPAAQPKQSIYESVEARGSVLEGVAKIEAKLAHQFAEGFGDFAKKVATDLDPRNINKVTMNGPAGAYTRNKTAPWRPDNKTAGEVAAQMKAKGASSDVDSLTRAAKAAGYTEGEETCNECGMYESECGCDHSMEEGKVHKGDYGYRDKQDTKQEPMKGPKGNDPFGRTPDTPPSGKEGRKIKGKADPHNDSGDAGHWGESVEPVAEKAKNKYAIGMAAAKKQAGYGSKPAHNLPKSVVKKGHEIAKSINEGINFADMMKETDSTVGEMLSELQNDINTFKKTGHCSDKLEAFLKIHNHGKRLMGETSPHAQHAMDLNPDFRAPTPAPGPLAKVGSALATGAKAVGKAIVGPNDKELLNRLADQERVNRYNEDAELNELARLAGLNVAESRDLPGNQDRLDVAEPKGKLTAADFDRLRGEVDEAELDEVGRGEYISQQDDAAEKAGRNKFNAFGQTFDTDEVEEGNRFTGGLEDDDIAIGQKIPGTNAIKKVDIDEMGECDMPGVPGMEKPGAVTVSTNQSSDGNKNVNISADGSAVDELMQMLKIAGLTGRQQDGGAEVATAEPKMVGVEIGDEGIEEEYANEPDPEYGTMDNAMGVGGDGDIAGAAHRNFGGAGDNRMSQQPDTPKLPVKEISLEARLAAEYESIKKVSK